MNRLIPIFGIVLLMVVSASLLPNINAYSQKNPTEKNTLNVKLETDPENPQPGENTKLKIEFLNPQTDTIQQHVDYIVSVENNGNSIFGPISLTHTSQGSVTIPVKLEYVKNTIFVDIEGVLFQPIAKELARFDVTVGEPVTQSNVNIENKNSMNETRNSSAEQKIPDWIKTNAAWWAQNKIDDGTFVSGIQYLIKQGIILVSPSSTSSNNMAKEIPQWIKNNADWWSQGLISNDDFLKGITFLIDNGIIIV